MSGTVPLPAPHRRLGRLPHLSQEGCAPILMLWPRLLCNWASKFHLLDLGPNCVDDCLQRPVKSGQA